MIDKELLAETVGRSLEQTDCFLVDVSVDTSNRIVVEIDSDTGVDIDTCASVTRAIEATFDRDAEDYELEVGSAGLTSPFKVKRQYDKNVGNEVEVLTKDGRKLHGTLGSVDDDGKRFTILVKEKVKEPGKKRPVEVETPLILDVESTKYVKYQINFK